MFGKGNKIDLRSVDKEALRILKKRKPKHTIFTLSEREQHEYMQLLRDAQGEFIKDGITKGVSEIAIPGLGTFIANPLRDLVEQTKKEFKDTLFPFEINQIIKQRLSTFFKENKNPFIKKKAQVRTFNFKSND